ncbi:hypothetical protein [Dokdonella sp.]|uniref:hypothetical protein n=1 Tax=Dokdonella sp. TaxID=2291710 RepID=UPI001B11A476|nr:hypothetical protein [Dokdonella sp.]MBO9662155.1 hypothetical protein [Dokdonella sp.]
MSTRIAASLALAGLAWVATWAGATTLEEDEARIEALIRAERAGKTVDPAPPPPVAAATLIVATAVPVPAPVVASVVAPPASSEEWLAAPARDAGLPFSELAQRIGQRVTIITANERVHRGVVGSADARQVTLRVKRVGGNATYTLSRSQIARIEPR